MYCTKCGKEILEGARFCPACGAPTLLAEATPAPAPVVRQRLLLDKNRKKIAGVCAGFARYFDMDVMLLRVLWLAIAICTGVGFIVYLAAWIIVPSDEGLLPEETLTRTV